jgi:hypothetical protein
MKLEIEIEDEIATSCELLPGALGASLSEVIEHHLYWGLARPMALDGIEFLSRIAVPRRRKCQIPGQTRDAEHGLMGHALLKDPRKFSSLLFGYWIET